MNLNGPSGLSGRPAPRSAGCHRLRRARHGSRREGPGRVRRLRGDLGHGHRGTPAFAPDAQREGMHHVLPFRVVVHTVLGQVDDDAFTRTRRQDIAGRQDDFGACARQPRVDTRVGSDHFQVAEVVGSADVGKGVFVLGLDRLDLANDVFTGWWQWQFQRSSGARYQQGGQGQATGDGGKARQHPVNPSKGSQEPRLYTRLAASGRHWRLTCVSDDERCARSRPCHSPRSSGQTGRMPRRWASRMARHRSHRRPSR